MPLSPFSRFLLVLIIALAGGALIVADLWDPTQLMAAAGAFAMVLAAFSSRVVNDMPPIDDQAFHLTLPPGHAGGFRRILLYHALLLGGIGAVIVARCVYLGGSVLGGVMAAFLICLPVLAFCAAMATAAGLSVKPGKWRLYALAALVLPPFASLYLLHRAQMLSPARVDCLALPVILTAGTLYPLAWLFTGLARMKVAGVATLAAAGALLPCLAVYGGMDRQRYLWPPVPQAHLAPAPGPRPASEALVAKLPPLPEHPGAVFSASLPEMLEPRRLGEGEFLLIHGLKVRGGDPAARPWLDFTPFPSPDAMSGGPPWGAGMWVGKSGDRSLWGGDELWDYLLTRLPGHEGLRFDPRFRGASSGLTSAQPLELSANPRRALEALRPHPWEVRLTGPVCWELAGPFDVERGGSARLPCGVFLKVPGAGREKRPLGVRIFGSRPTLLDRRHFGPLFGKPVVTGAPQIFVIARDGKSGVALETSVRSPEEGLHLMEFEDWDSDYGSDGGSKWKVLTGEKDSPSFPAFMPWPREVFDKARLYVRAGLAAGWLPGREDPAAVI